jgi:hypothetical protein
MSSYFLGNYKVFYNYDKFITRKVKCAFLKNVRFPLRFPCISGIKKRRGVNPSFPCLNTANSENLYTLFTFSCQSSFASPPLTIYRFDLFYHPLAIQAQMFPAPLVLLFLESS